MKHERTNGKPTKDRSGDTSRADSDALPKASAAGHTAPASSDAGGEEAGDAASRAEEEEEEVQWQKPKKGRKAALPLPLPAQPSSPAAPTLAALLKSDPPSPERSRLQDDDEEFDWAAHKLYRQSFFCLKTWSTVGSVF